jgi:hypothetical protein
MGRAPGRFKQLQDIARLVDRTSKIQVSESWVESALLVSYIQELLVAAWPVGYERWRSEVLYVLDSSRRSDLHRSPLRYTQRL